MEEGWNVGRKVERKDEGWKEVRMKDEWKEGRKQ